MRTILKPVMKNADIKTIAPLDDYLAITNLPFKASRKLMTEIAFWGQNQSSFKEASSTIEKVIGIKINSETVRLITDFVGNIVFDQDSKQANNVYNNIHKLELTNTKEGILYIETDGSALNTRIEDENGSTWRENKLGMVFSSDNIVTFTNDLGETHNKVLKKEYTSLLGSAEEFKKYLLNIAVKNGYGQYEKTIILSDGATWIRNMGNDIFPDALQILDLYHLCENTYSYAKAIFHNNETKYSRWAIETINLLKNSEYEYVLKDLKKYKNHQLPPGVVNLSTYITNNINKIDYKKYKELGYFIGSGAIESGNKTVLQKRCKQAGMRWSEGTAQPILTLRAKYASDLWTNEVAKKIMGYDFPVQKKIAA